MSSIEEIKKGRNSYFSFVKKSSFMGKNFLYKRYLGKNVAYISKEKYLLDNLKKIEKAEFEFKWEFLKEIIDKISYNKNLSKEIEKKSISINNLKDVKKNLPNLDVNFAIKFIYNSNNIEGSKIPEEAVKKIIEEGKLDYKNKNEARETLNSISAFRYLKDFNFNLSSLKRIYNLLIKDLIMETGEKYPRGFRKIELVVGNSKTLPYENIEKEIKKLFLDYRKKRKKIHPFILAFDFHLSYEIIHPFRDGNGRTGRLILNKILMQNGYPPMIVFKENKSAYFNAIKFAIKGNKKKYYQFMLEQMNKSYDFILELLKRY
ncbi:Fic family protein [Candidatus Pacearchaeota archaeon]|nr:Fic family protein [Candidatus Pacearchaeota archaeon]